MIPTAGKLLDPAGKLWKSMDNGSSIPTRSRQIFSDDFQTISCENSQENARISSEKSGDLRPEHSFHVPLISGVNLSVLLDQGRSKTNK